jgi:hypothetical protein
MQKQKLEKTLHGIIIGEFLAALISLSVMAGGIFYEDSARNRLNLVREVKYKNPTADIKDFENIYGQKMNKGSKISKYGLSGVALFAVSMFGTKYLKTYL